MTEPLPKPDNNPFPTPTYREPEPETNPALKKQAVVIVLTLIVIVALILFLWQKLFPPADDGTLHPYGTTALTGVNNISTTVSPSGVRNVDDMGTITIDDLPQGVLYLTTITVALPDDYTVNEYRNETTNKTWEAYTQGGNTLPTVNFGAVNPDWCPPLENIDGNTTGTFTYCVAFAESNPEDGVDQPGTIIYDTRDGNSAAVKWGNPADN